MQRIGSVRPQRGSRCLRICSVRQARHFHARRRMVHPWFSSLLRRHTLYFVLCFHRLDSAFTSLTGKSPSKDGLFTHPPPQPPPHQCKYMRASNNHASTGAPGEHRREAPVRAVLPAVWGGGGGGWW